MNLREQLFSYVKKKYNAAPEYLWMRFPDYAVFRHADNGKWFGIVMNVSGEKLGLDDDVIVDILIAIQKNKQTIDRHGKMII